MDHAQDLVVLRLPAPVKAALDAEVTNGHFVVDGD